MYELNSSHTSVISGGVMIYVTEEWKHYQGMLEAIQMGIPLGVVGAFFGFIEGNIGMTLGFAIGAAIGGAIGYGLSRLENSSLDNDTWYDIIYI